VVEGQADSLLGTGGSDGVTTGVLNLLDQILVTLLSEAAALLSVEEDVVCPDGWLGSAEVRVDPLLELDVDAHLVVLEGDEWEVETWVTVEEEDEREIHDTLRVG